MKQVSPVRVNIRHKTSLHAPESVRCGHSLARPSSVLEVLSWIVHPPKPRMDVYKGMMCVTFPSS